MEIIYFKIRIKEKIVKLNKNCRFLRFEKPWFHRIRIKSKNVIFIEQY